MCDVIIVIWLALRETVRSEKDMFEVLNYSYVREIVRVVYLYLDYSLVLVVIC